MKDNTRRSFMKLSAAAAALGSVGGLLVGSKDALADDSRSRGGLKLNVCCNASTFGVIDPQQSAVPGNGATFVVQGVIYAGDYFATHGDTAGLVAGSGGTFVAQDPQLVLGTWYCRGWFINKGMASSSGPFVATTQIYDLNNAGRKSGTIISDGIELIDMNTPWQRAVTGGSGFYKTASGEVTQEAIAANASTLFNFKFAFNLS